MSFEIEIAESEEELASTNIKLGKPKEKLQMLWWIKSGQVKEQEIRLRLAKYFNGNKVVAYRSGGLSELLKIKKSSRQTKNS